MALEHLDGLELPAAADMHVHLRDGAMTELVVYELRPPDEHHMLTETDLPYEMAVSTWFT